jgi:hypothetical protein
MDMEWSMLIRSTDLRLLAGMRNGVKGRVARGSGGSRANRALPVRPGMGCGHRGGWMGRWVGGC